MNQKRIGKIPGYFSLTSSFERVEKSGLVINGQPDYELGIPSQRLIIKPSYTLHFLKIPWLNGTLKLSSRQGFYAKSKDLETKEIVDEPIHLQSHQVETVLEGPTFYKIYDFKKKRIKNIIEPSISFRYATEYSETEMAQLVRVDHLDFPLYSYIGFSLRARFLVKDKYSESSPRELLTLSSEQQYYFDPETANLGRKIDGEYPEFSELRNSVKLRFMDNFSLTGSLVYNYYINKFSRLNLQVSFQNKANSIQGSLGFSSYTNPFYLGLENEFNGEVLRGSLRVDIPDFPLRINSAVDYDFARKEVRYGSVHLMYKYQCLNFRFEFRMVQRLTEVESQLRFGFSLGNLGIVPQFLMGGEQ
jgi:lipopolysaccharide assembly outer membrane protein LptD (OstA)